jgi:hypothetical protein
VNEKLAEVAFVGEAGAEPIAVSGAVRSTTQARVAGVPSVFPTGSVARTSKACAPSPRPL